MDGKKGNGSDLYELIKSLSMTIIEGILDLQKYDFTDNLVRPSDAEEDSPGKKTYYMQ